ncbi:hydrolase [Anaerotignum sp.]|uniref:hydrolase n=1 Tax=Anaerotignum sp. TaxID=2039241 RepID=UPI00399FC0F1
MAEKKPPRIDTRLRKHIVTMPEEIWAASGIVIWGRRIKSLVFSTDIAIIRNCNADAVLAVYPFTPQQVITNSIITASSIPVFAGVGGGTTTGPRVVMLAKDAEALGAMAVVVNAPTTNEVIHEISKIVDIPVVITVLDENTDIDARIAAGAGILNISAAGKHRVLRKFGQNILKFRLLPQAALPEKVSNAPLKRAQMPSASHHLPQWICSMV